MVKEVRVVTDGELIFRLAFLLAVIAAPFVLISLFFERFPIGSWVVVGSVVGGYLLVSDVGYSLRLRARLARRDRRLAQFEADGFEELNRCIDNVNQLKAGGLGDDDVRRDMLVGERFERKAALAALEEAQDPWPRALLVLRWREKGVRKRLFPRYTHAPVLASGRSA